LRPLHLLVEHSPGRYGFHDLLSAFQADLPECQEADEQSRAVFGRLLDHYLHTACAADQLVFPEHDMAPVPIAPPGPGTVAGGLALDHEGCIRPR
jgi:hypothetical protein